MVFTFAEAAKAGPYDERPMLPDSLDLQIHLSRNAVPQPFHLICQHDTVLFALSGAGHVEYKDASVLRHSYGVGDHLYVPAGVPHRILPASETTNTATSCRNRIWKGLPGTARAAATSSTVRYGNSGTSLPRKPISASRAPSVPTQSAAAAANVAPFIPRST